MITLWLMGIAGSLAFGSTGLHGQACTWPAAEPAGFVCTPFRGAYWPNGTVCTALSTSGRFAAVEWAYRNGELWWCWNHDCQIVDGGGFVLGIDNSGNMWGKSAAVNAHAVLWTWWPTVRRWDFPQWRSLESWGERPNHNLFTDSRGNDVWIARYDGNADGVVDMFDIDAFVESLAMGTPTDGAFFMRNADIDPFVSEVLR